MCSVLQSLTFFLFIVALSDGLCPSDGKLSLIDFNNLIVLAIGASATYTFFEPNYEKKFFYKCISFFKKYAVTKSISILLSIKNKLIGFLRKFTKKLFFISRLKYYLRFIHNENDRFFLKSAIHDFELFNKTIKYSYYIPLFVSKVIKRTYSSTFFHLLSFICVVYSFLLLWLSAFGKKFYIYGAIEWLIIIVLYGLIFCYVCKLSNLNKNEHKLTCLTYAICVCIFFILAIIFGYPLPLPIGEDTVIVIAVITCYLNFLCLPLMVVLFPFLFLLFSLLLFFNIIMFDIALLGVLLRIYLKAPRVRTIISDLETMEKDSFDDNDFDYSTDAKSGK